MALTNTLAVQMTALQNFPIEDHGKLRFHFFDVTQGAAAGDDGSTFDLGRMPMGRIRVLPHLSRISGSAYGASRVLKLGHRAYSKEQNATEAENLSAFGSALDVSAATNAIAVGTGLKYDLFSRKGWLLAGQITGGTIPVAATLKGYLVYIHE